MLQTFEPDRVLVLHRDQGETTALPYDGGRSAIPPAARAVGHSSPVNFDYSAIVLVEGATELVILPKVMNHFAPPGHGICFQRIPHTDDLNAKPRRVGPIVARTLKGSHRLAFPNAACVVLRDREFPVSDTTSQQFEPVDGVDYLEHPMLEDYLLVPGAVASVASRYAGGPVTESEISDLMERHKEAHSRRGWDGTDRPHAANLLHAVLTEATSAKLDYAGNKPSVANEIVDQILSSNAAHLRPLFNELQDAITTARKSP